jgi:outer membrane protein insertion porin family
MRQAIWLMPALAIMLFCSQVAAVPAKIISRVEVDGCVHTRSEEVKEVLETKAGDDFARLDTQKKIWRDVKNVMALGYYKDMKALEKPMPDGDGIILIYVVEELPRITKLEFEGNLSMSDSELRKDIGFDRNSRFFAEEGQIEKLRLKVLEIYTEKGYPFREVVAEAPWEIDANNVRVVFQVREGRKLKVGSITFVGNNSFKDRKLRRVMETKKSFLFFTQKFNEEKFAADLDSIRNFYRFGHGFLDVVVRRGEETIKGKGINLVVEIEEGIQYIVGSRKVLGNSIFTSDEILAVMDNKPGEIFSMDTLYNKDMRRIEQLYKGQGYLKVNAGASYEKTEGEEGVVDVFVDFNRPKFAEGNRMRLGKIFLHGVRSRSDEEGAEVDETPMYTKEHVIRRQIGLETGEVLDWSKVLEADRKIARLGRDAGFFELKPPSKTLNLGRLKHGFSYKLTDDPEIADLLLELEEKEDPRFVTFGGGYSTTYGPFVGVTLRDPNLFGYGQDLQLSTSLGTRRRRFSITLTEPYFRATDTSVALQVFSQSRNEYRGREFDESRTGFGVTFGRRLSRNLSASLGYLLESVEISDINNGIREAVELPEFYEDRTSITSKLRMGLAWDTRDYDNFNIPYKGRLFSGNMDVAGIGGDNQFVKFLGRGEFHRKLADKVYFQSRSRLLVGSSYGGNDDLPLQERFFIGGTSSLRGFEEAAVGPKDEIVFYNNQGPTAGMYVRDIFTGGELAYTTQSELHYRFNKLFTGVGFVDWGANHRSISDFDLGELRTSAGVGLRVRLPIGGVLQMDVAIPLSTQEEDDTDNFHFGFGAGMGF